ncbi:unnamed protein product [Urochloa humidicola]
MPGRPLAPRSPIQWRGYVKQVVCCLDFALCLCQNTSGTLYCHAAALGFSRTSASFASAAGSSSASTSPSLPMN